MQRELVKTRLVTETESADWMNSFLERFWLMYVFYHQGGGEKEGYGMGLMIDMNLFSVKLLWLVSIMLWQLVHLHS
jgi:hypothetical protein